MKAHPALFEGVGEGKGQKKLRNTIQRLRPKEFSSGDFGLRSFRWPEIWAWAEISDISGRKLRIFQRGAGRGWEGEKRGVNGFKAELHHTQLTENLVQN